MSTPSTTSRPEPKGLTASHQTPGPVAASSKLGVWLAAAGAILVALAANSALQPDPAPYERAAVPVDRPSLAGFGFTDERVAAADFRRLEWRASGVRGPVASALVATDTERRAVPLDWQNFVTEPVLSADLSVAEVAKVLSAIRQHVPESATILSWWDLSRKIRFVAERSAPLDDPLARGLLVPTAWTKSAERVLTGERAFWGSGVPQSDQVAFGRYIDALLMEERAGAKALQALAPGGDTYVVVHLSDIWKAASVRPDKISIAFRDFPGAGQAHGVIKATRQWMNETKMDGAYAVEPIGNAVRLHYLTNKESAGILLTKLLPFSESNPMRLDEFELVYQHRGFWIYKIKPNGGK